MLNNVKSIKNDLGVWKKSFGKWNISSRHIHSDKLYLLSDFQWILQKVVSYSGLAAIIKDGIVINDNNLVLVQEQIQELTNLGEYEMAKSL